MKKLLIILMFATIFTSASCKNKLPTTKITIERADKTTIDVIAEIAKTPEERNYGFMNRKKIPDGTGMIFIFEQDQILSFWLQRLTQSLFHPCQDLVHKASFA